MNDAAAKKLDLALAGHMVDAALGAAQISADERQRLACAKALLRLEPAPDAKLKPGDFAKALQDIGLG